MTSPKRIPPESNPILTTDQEETASIWSLILSAVQIPHQIYHSNHTWHLFVPAGKELRAIHELECYAAENKDWPPKRPAPNHDFTPLMQPPTLLLIGAIILFYSVTGPWNKDSIWFMQGAGNADDILQKGEWWRLLTALTLHADMVHLLSNCLIGGWLVHSFCLLTGTGLGLSSLVLTAGCGNLINVLIHRSEYQFVGFSTAVFAVIGMLAVLTHQGRRKFTGSHFLIPVMAGAALLAAIGSSGEHTDLGAHFFGLLCGLLSGYLLSHEPLHRLRHSLSFQCLCFVFFFILLIGSWVLALHQ
ncbi:MAG: rhomboid family intramembrane serine protease [Desulfobulbaceae bacterium]|jgi:membrane associated rhomboid family serine protease|nr:rhomboid family intramembrane serine protease [Desulfobulbaceae bacterium]